MIALVRLVLCIRYYLHGLPCVCNVLRNNKPYRLLAQCVVYLDLPIHCLFLNIAGPYCVSLHGLSNKGGHIRDGCNCGNVITW